jgi:hypothetical protein
MAGQNKTVDLAAVPMRRYARSRLEPQQADPTLAVPKASDFDETPGATGIQGSWALPPATAAKSA